MTRRPSARSRLARVAAAISLALVAALCAPATARADYAGFRDVGASDWYVTDGYLDYALGHELLRGYDDETFGPSGAVIRGDVAMVLWRVAGEPEAGEPSFADVPSGSYYATAIEWARSQGIVNGYSETEFLPERAVSREELAAMLQRYATNVARIDASSDCAALDAIPGAKDVSKFARGAMGWAVDTGILTGKVSGDVSYVDPQGTAVRAELAKMATVFHRDVLRLGSSGQPAPGVELAEGVDVVPGGSYEVTGEHAATITGAAADSVERGDVIVLEPSSQNPGGTALKVTSVSDLGGETLVSGTEPDLSEVTDNLQLSSAGAPARVISVTPAPGVQMRDDVTGMVETMATSSDSIDLVKKTFDLPNKVGTVKINSQLEYSFDYSWGGIRQLDVSIDANADLDLSVSESLEGEPIKVASLTLASSWGVTIDVDVYITYSASGTVEFWAEASAEAGVTYKNGSWSQHSDGGFDYGMSFDGQAKAGVRPTVTLEFLSIDLVDASAELGGTLDGEVERRESGMVCCDVAAWMYLDLSVGQEDTLAHKLGLSKTFHLMDEDNSPKLHAHLEDGAIVDECTWGKTLGRYGAYLEKVRELEQAYGEGRVVSGSFGSIPAKWVAGACMVDLIDFGDGVERLVTACGNGSLFQSFPNSFDAYDVTVWDYSEKDDEAVAVWRGNMSASNGGYASVSFSTSPDGSRTYLVRMIPDANYTFVGLRADGSIGVVHVADSVIDLVGTEGFVYTIDGSRVSAQEYWDLLASMGLGTPSGPGSLTDWTLSAYNDEINEPDATLRAARATIAELERAAGSSA